MIPCPSCACHVSNAERTCPHCGLPVRHTGGTTRAAALLSLALVSCVGATKGTPDSGTTTTPMPLYGVTVVDYSTTDYTDFTDADTDVDTDTDADSDADTDTAIGGSGTTSGSGGSGAGGSGATVEPMYGVVTTTKP